jgi:polyhydroxyalkanoate synthesis repressor PhaR
MEPILIKRYPNRRLYDTGRSAYITLDELAIDLSSGRRVRVEESKTGRDITKRVLVQALLTDQQARKLSCLPSDFLFTLLQLEDPTMLALFGHYVRSTLSTFSTAQKVTQHNVELMKKLTPNPTQLLSNLNALLRRGDDKGRG